MEKIAAGKFAGLPGNLGAIAEKLVAKREAEGLNVHFLRKNGTTDRFSLATADRADAFRASLRRQGRTVLS